MEDDDDCNEKDSEDKDNRENYFQRQVICKWCNYGIMIMLFFFDQQNSNKNSEKNNIGDVLRTILCGYFYELKTIFVKN